MPKHVLLTKNWSSGEWQIESAHDSYAELRQALKDYAADFDDDILPEYGEDYRTMIEEPVYVENIMEADAQQCIEDVRGALAEAREAA